MEETLQIPIQVSRKHAWRKVVIIIGGVLVLLLAAGGYLYHRSHTSPAPALVRKAVPFTIYYPRQAKLPRGYRLDTASFRLAQPGVVLFSVSYANNRSMVFSEEAKPTSDVINKFNSSAIPVHTPVSTMYGEALVGAYGGGKNLRTLASLPITNGPWLIITAPADANQADLSQVLRSLAK